MTEGTTMKLRSFFLPPPNPTVKQGALYGIKIGFWIGLIGMVSQAINQVMHW